MKREYPVVAVVLPVGKRVFWGVMQLADSQLAMPEVTLAESYGELDVATALMVLREFDEEFNLDAFIIPDKPELKALRDDLEGLGYCFALCQWDALPLHTSYQSDYFKLMAVFANIKATMRNTAMNWFDDLVGAYGHTI